MRGRRTLTASCINVQLNVKLVKEVNHFLNIKESYNSIHFPSNKTILQKAILRLKFAEFSNSIRYWSASLHWWQIRATNGFVSVEGPWLPSRFRGKLNRESFHVFG